MNAIATVFGQPNGICEGCLSCDRTLAPVSEEINAVYSCYIHEKVQERSSPLLCWECIANTQKFLRFKKKCLHATYLLNKYTVSSTKVTSLSTINIAHNGTYNIVEDSQQDSIQDSHNYFSATCQQNITNNKDINFIFKQDEGCDTSKYDSENSTVVEEHKSEVDIPFVKVEEDVFEDVEGCFVDDGFANQDAVDSKDFDPTLIEQTDTETKVKRKKVRKKKVVDDFNYSDEEPLYKKKKSKSVTEKKCKKEKENDVMEQAGSKPGSRRREKPAGVVNNPRVQKKLQQLNIPEGLLEMVLLSWEEVEEERQVVLRSASFARHLYSCRLCAVGFNHRHKLDNHMEKHQPGAGPLACGVCGVRCRHAHALAAHTRRHRLRWRCCVCGARWSRVGGAADHVATHHALDTAPTHTCTHCGHTAPSLGKLRTHMKSHSARQECPHCGKTFRDRSSLRTHLFIHGGTKEYSCPKCHKQFLFKKALEVHLVTHDPPAHLYCLQCDVTFKNRMSLSQHLRYSLKHAPPHALRFACEQCDKRFVKSSRLQEHQVAVHLKLSPVHCAVAGCNFACSSRPVLRTHTRMVHRNARALRNHVCHTCGNTYTTKKSLEGHLRSHTGERPFRCGECPSAFGYEAALYNHSRLVHRGDKTNKRATQQPLPVQDTVQPSDETDIQTHK